MNKAEVKRIFITGPPGGMWTTLDRWIRIALAPNVDNSDITPQRRWEGHMGAYWHPGNEPSWDWILNFGDYDRDHIIETLDSAYTDPIPDASEKEFIIRTHKSHAWACHYDKIVELFPEADILSTVMEPHYAFMWWKICGGHDTVFNDYKYYNRDYRAIWEETCLHTDKTNEFAEKYNLPKEYYNLDFLRKYYGTIHPNAERRDEEQIKNPNEIDNFLGRPCDGSGLNINAKTIIKLGNPRQFKL
jgi:hypothetical protein